MWFEGQTLGIVMPTDTGLDRFPLERAAARPEVPIHGEVSSAKSQTTLGRSFAAKRLLPKVRRIVVSTFNGVFIQRKGLCRFQEPFSQ